MAQQRKPRQFRNNQEAEVPTGPDDFTVDTIVRTDCLTHDAVRGEYCFYAKGLTESRTPILGVCNDRAKAAGFNHPVSPLSMTRRPYEQK